MRLHHLRNMVLVILTLVLATLSWPAFAALEDEVVKKVPCRRMHFSCTGFFY